MPAAQAHRVTALAPAPGLGAVLVAERAPCKDPAPISFQLPMFPQGWFQLHFSCPLSLASWLLGSSQGLASSS